MVLYFTGTGNSKYAAKVIAGETGDSVIDLFERLKSEDHSELKSEKPWVLVVPTYAYKIPPLVEEWLIQTPLEGNESMYFVMTCGSGIGGAGAYNKQLCEVIGKKYMGTAKILMPENYIAMFKAPDYNQAVKIVENAVPAMKAVANTILTGGFLLSKSEGKLAKIGSAIVNKTFFGAFVKDNKFRVSDACNGCGKCERSCVKRNIVMIDKKPVWRGDCTHCMACICGCPKKAIDFGKSTVKKVRYKCPK